MKTAIIDADSLLYFEQNAPTFEAGCRGIDTRIANMLDATGATCYNAYLTPPRTFRHEIATVRPYKGNRPDKELPPLFYGLRAYMLQTHQASEVPTLEADDMIAIHAAAAAKAGESVVVCAYDKDVLGQIAGHHWNYQKAEWVTTTPEQAENFLWSQVLTGDSTDNVEGVPGIGAKKAAEILLAPGTLAQKTIQAYMNHFQDSQVAVARFAEMFQLIALKTVLPVHLLSYVKTPRLRSQIAVDAVTFDDFDSVDDL
jgi:hypothetical protein